MRIPYDPEGEAAAIAKIEHLCARAERHGPLNRRLRLLRAAVDQRLRERAFAREQATAEEQRRQPELDAFGARVAAADAARVSAVRRRQRRWWQVAS